ncbi:MAG: TIGR03663 family protein [Haloquadratum sp. J07HQX50]|nr:MAG: TIGR03663 family protein [Haloquadratum sp. J07HQX50]
MSADGGVEHPHKSPADSATIEKIMRFCRRYQVALLLGFTTIAAIFIRIVDLGGRVFHWDEGRVGYWILRFHETGIHTYRPIVHGPFIPVIDRWLFEILAVTDATARLPVAIIGGLLPLAAWLFRSRLRRIEVIVLAVLFALSPLLVYYSRFMRNDVLVAVFAIFALGFIIRAIDTGKLRYILMSAAALGLSFTTKENAILYPVCFVGAALLIVDRRFFLTENKANMLRQWKIWLSSALSTHGSTRGNALLRITATAVGSGAIFMIIFVFFYAPRPELWQALSAPGQLPGVLRAGSIGAIEDFISMWATGERQDHPYLPYLYDLAETLVYGAPAIVTFGLIGIFTNRYRLGQSHRRPFISFTFFWATASLVGYPLATDIQAPWVGVHVLVPLAVPAAVGIAVIFNVIREGLENTDYVTAGLAAMILFTGVFGIAAANTTYFNSTAEADKQVLQWAQPENELKQTLDTVDAVAEANQGLDVLFVGTTPPNGNTEDLYVRNETSAAVAPPGGPAWHSRLPVPWYLERANANVTSTDPSVSTSEALSDPPPIVISKGHDQAEVETVLSEYQAFEHNFRLWGDRIVIFIDRDAMHNRTQESN